MREVKLIVCRGAGDLATGILYSLHNAGYQGLALETAFPTTIRRQVAFSSAVNAKTCQVEGKRAICIGQFGQENPLVNARTIESESALRAAMEDAFTRDEIPVLIDPDGKSIELLQPEIVIDAIIAKKNLGTDRRKMSWNPYVIGVGPGFIAGEDVDAVIETMRGEHLGQIIYEGVALPDTKTPGNVGGYTKERVLHAPTSGVLSIVKDLGEAVEAGEVIAEIYVSQCEAVSVRSQIAGFVRGMIADGFPVKEGLKIADVDPRPEERENYDKITDKAHAIGESVCQCLNQIP